MALYNISSSRSLAFKPHQAINTTRSAGRLLSLQKSTIPNSLEHPPLSQGIYLRISASAYACKTQARPQPINLIDYYLLSTPVLTGSND